LNLKTQQDLGISRTKTMQTKQEYTMFLNNGSQNN